MTKLIRASLLLAVCALLLITALTTGGTAPAHAATLPKPPVTTPFDLNSNAFSSAFPFLSGLPMQPNLGSKAGAEGNTVKSAGATASNAAIRKALIAESKANIAKFEADFNASMSKLLKKPW